MRLGSRSPNGFIMLLNEKNVSIQKSFLSKIIDLTNSVTVKVMMGDSTVTEQTTFDPKLITDYFQGVGGLLKDWSLQDVSTTSNQDIRRIFTKFEIKEGNYLISGHLSLQFHVLLYYKPEQRVIDCQKELSQIVDKTKNEQMQISDNSDQAVLNKLKEMGYKDLDHQKLFEIFYEDDKLREKIFAQIQDNAGVDFQALSEKKRELLAELDSLLIETYQTSSVLIDDPKLVGGEEGCLLTLDLEFVKDGVRQGVFDPRKMSEQTRKVIDDRITEIHKAVLSL